MRRTITAMVVVGALALGGVLGWQWRERFYAGTARPVAAPLPGAWGAAIERVGWLGSPGPLTDAHKALSTECRACHVPFRTAADVKCLGCHARNAALLSRLDTAFHAQATRCVTCHTEHRGETR